MSHHIHCLCLKIFPTAVAAKSLGYTDEQAQSSDREAKCLLYQELQ